MNLNSERYNKFALVREMIEVCDLVKNSQFRTSRKCCKKYKTNQADVSDRRGVVNIDLDKPQRARKVGNIF